MRSRITQRTDRFAWSCAKWPQQLTLGSLRESQKLGGRARILAPCECRAPQFWAIFHCLISRISRELDRR